MLTFLYFQIPIKKIKFKDVSHSMKSIKDRIKLKYNIKIEGLFLSSKQRTGSSGNSISRETDNK